VFKAEKVSGFHPGIRVQIFWEFSSFTFVETGCLHLQGSRIELQLYTGACAVLKLRKILCLSADINCTSGCEWKQHWNMFVEKYTT